jgi:hypothetical protein
MTLTQKEIDTLAIFNKKGLVYEYVQVQSFGVNGMTTVNKLVKIGKKGIKSKFNPANTSELSSLSMSEITDAQVARTKQAMKNNL